MKRSEFETSIVQSFQNFWHRLVEPSSELAEMDQYLSRVLNAGLLILIFAGGIAQIEFMARSNQIIISDLIVIVAILVFAVAYSLNRKGHFMSATILTLSAFIIGIFAIQYLNQGNVEGISVLFYLIIPILMGEFFLSLRGYLVVVGLILGGMLGLVSFDPKAVDIFFFFLIFSALVGVASANRRRIQRQRQASLRRNEEMYRSVISAMAEGIVVQGVDGKIQTSNTSAERILGLSAVQLQGTTSLDPRWRAIHEDGSDFPGVDHPAMVTLRSGEPQKGVIMGVYKPDGSLTWISINAQPLFKLDKTTPDGVVATFTDITREYNLLVNEKQHARQMKALNEIINTALETSDFRQMLQIFADRLGDLLEADGAYITLWNETTRRTVPAAA
jgi:PAS domain S-box-containing protein